MESKKGSLCIRLVFFQAISHSYFGRELENKSSCNDLTVALRVLQRLPMTPKASSANVETHVRQARKRTNISAQGGDRFKLPKGRSFGGRMLSAELPKPGEVERARERINKAVAKLDKAAPPAAKPFQGGEVEWVMGKNRSQRSARDP